MNADQFRRAVRAQFGEGAPSSLTLAQLCGVCQELTSFPASIVLSVSNQPPAAVAASDGAGVIEQLQLTLGEGPGVDAYAGGHAVFVRSPSGATPRWMHFAPAAHALGVRAVYAFPLQLGAVRIGVLSFYAGRPDLVVDGMLGEMTTLAGFVTNAVLAMQSGAPAEELSWSLSSAAEHRAVVHQATGMLTVQLQCSAQDALARLRAKAFADEVEVEEVARLVVTRQLRFER